MLLLFYMTAMLLIESLFVAVQARTVQFVYIDNRNYPGEPDLSFGVAIAIDIGHRGAMGIFLELANSCYQCHFLRHALPSHFPL
jgi:hypothetical protein